MVCKALRCKPLEAALAASCKGSCSFGGISECIARKSEHEGNLINIGDIYGYTRNIIPWHWLVQNFPGPGIWILSIWENPLLDSTSAYIINNVSIGASVWLCCLMLFPGLYSVLGCLIEYRFRSTLALFWGPFQVISQDWWIGGCIIYVICVYCVSKTYAYTINTPTFWCLPVNPPFKVVHCEEPVGKSCNNSAWFPYEFRLHCVW